MLEWVRTRESNSESESTRPESESESESIRSESESIRCESESIGPESESESESESIGPESESESESSGSESESESLSPDSVWTHESNNRKVLYILILLLIILLSFVLIIGSQPKFPLFLLRYSDINRGETCRLKPWYCVTGIKVYIQPRSLQQQQKESLFQKVVIKKKSFKRVVWNLQFYINIQLFGVKTVRNTIMNLQNIDLPACRLQES